MCIGVFIVLIFVIQEPSILSSLLTGLTTAVAHHRSIWPSPSSLASSSDSSPQPSTSTMTLSQLAAKIPSTTRAYESLRTIRHYLNIIYMMISTHNTDATIVPLLMDAKCGSLSLITYMFELLPSSPPVSGNGSDDNKSLDLNTILPWKKVVLLIRQLIVILVVPPVVCHPPRTGNTPGTCIDGTRTSSATPSTTATPSSLSMPVQYGVKSRLNDLRDACADATLRFSPVSFFPGDRFTPPDYMALSDLPADVRYD
jgi:hypothetical protein